MVSLTLSARPEITSGSPCWSAAKPSVSTGSQNSMIHFDGRGTAPIGPSHGKRGGTGKYGQRHRRGAFSRLPNHGENPSAPTMAHGMIGAPARIAVAENP